MFDGLLRKENIVPYFRRHRMQRSENDFKNIADGHGPVIISNPCTHFETRGDRDRHRQNSGRFRR